MGIRRWHEEWGTISAQGLPAGGSEADLSAVFMAEIPSIGASGRSEIGGTIFDSPVKTMFSRRDAAAQRKTYIDFKYLPLWAAGRS